MLKVQGKKEFNLIISFLLCYLAGLRNIIVKNTTWSLAGNLFRGISNQHTTHRYRMIQHKQNRLINLFSGLYPGPPGISTCLFFHGFFITSFISTQKLRNSFYPKQNSLLLLQSHTTTKRQAKMPSRVQF